MSQFGANPDIPGGYMDHLFQWQLFPLHLLSAQTNVYKHCRQLRCKRGKIDKYGLVQINELNNEGGLWLNLFGKSGPNSTNSLFTNVGIVNVNIFDTILLFIGIDIFRVVMNWDF